MAAETYKLETILDLPRLSTRPYDKRNLGVQMQRSSCGNYRAVLVDLGEFGGEGSTGGLAIDDLANELEHVAAEIRRASGKTHPDHDRVRKVYIAAIAWRRQVNLVPASSLTQALIDVIDWAIAVEDGQPQAEGPYR